MSEFKFACPVCGQHITADSKSSGTQLECPTCFRKIVVPQAPASEDSKFILSAAEAAKPRPVQNGTGTGLIPARPARNAAPLLLLGFLCLCGAAVYVWRDKLFPRSPERHAQAVTNAVLEATNRPPPEPVVYPIPTNIAWTLDLTNTAIPDGRVAGSIHGEGFFCERAVVTGGNLALRQGAGWPPDLGINIQFFARRGEELSGKTIEVTPDRVPPLPRVVLRWKDEQRRPEMVIITNDYLLKVTFGQATNGRIPGKLYLGLPDEARSFVGGAFDAEIRKPAPPRRPKAQGKSPR